MSELGNPTLVDTVTAGEALTAYRCVKLDTDGTAILTTSINDTVYGVTLEAAASGARVSIAIEGIVAVTVDGNATNITYGDQMISHSSAGDAQKIGSTAATVYKTFARSLGVATADGARIRCHLTPGNTYTTPA